jgi:hypothetical protein
MPLPEVREQRYPDLMQKFDVASRRARALICGMGNFITSLIRRRVPVFVCAATLVVGACSSSGGNADQASSSVGGTSAPTASQPTSSTTSTPAPSTTSSAATSTTSSAPPEAELRAAVRAFWDLYVDVGGRTSSLDLATMRTRLAERTTGDELLQLAAFFTTNKNSGFVVRGTVDIAPVVVSSTATTAQVRDCHDDRTGLYRADGSRVDTDNPLRHRVLMTLTLEGGIWKVASIANEGDGCVA